MKVDLTKDEISEIHRALLEVLDFFEESKAHQKENPKGDCSICKEYRKLERKFRKLSGETKTTYKRIRTYTHEELIKVIKKMYKKKKTLYPSDVVDKIHYDYKEIEKAFKQLEKEGFIKRGKERKKKKRSKKDEKS